MRHGLDSPLSAILVFGAFSVTLGVIHLLGVFGPDADSVANRITNHADAIRRTRSIVVRVDGLSPTLGDELKAIEDRLRALDAKGGK